MKIRATFRIFWRAYALCHRCSFVGGTFIGLDLNSFVGGSFIGRFLSSFVWRQFLLLEGCGVAVLSSLRACCFCCRVSSFFGAAAAAPQSSSTGINIVTPSE
jgi:hypothetical protein